jgi:hypothetical protein
MDAKLKNFQLMMKSVHRFKIPEYQRPYCWTLEEVEQLWNDLEGAFSDYKDKSSPTQGEEYFLGPVVVANEKDHKGRLTGHVVDGQQRLTTLHSLLWTTYLKLQKSTHPAAPETVADLKELLLTPREETRLAVAREDQSDFLALREGTPLNEQRQLGKTGAFIRRHVDAFSDTDSLLEFLNYLLYQVNFVHVETENFAAAWDLFIGLNGKGRPLTPADLIKAFVCGNSKDAEAMADIWKEKILPLGNDSTSAILEVVRTATGEVGSDAKLFKLFERAWSEGRVMAPLLANGAEVFHRIWLTPIDKIPDIGPEKRMLRGLRTLSRRDHTSVMLAMGAKFGAGIITNPRLLRALEAFQLWMAARGLRGRERQFTELAHLLHKKTDSLSEAYDQLRSVLTRMAPPENDVRNAILNLRYPGRIMKFVVLQYEEGLRGDVEVGDVTYEHMMPQEPTGFWFAAAGTTERGVYDGIVNGIGNMAPLDANTNIVGSNDDWPTKTALYLANVPTWYVSQIARDNPEWTTDRIKTHASAIADWAVTERWNLPDALAKMVP